MSVSQTSAPGPRVLSSGNRMRCQLASCGQLFDGATWAKYCSVGCRASARKARSADISVCAATIERIRAGARAARLSIDAFAERAIIAALDIAEHGPAYVPPPVEPRLCARPECGRELPAYARHNRRYCHIDCSRKVHNDRETARYHATVAAKAVTL